MICKAKYLKRKTPSKEGWKFPLSNSLGNVHSSVSTARVRPRTENHSVVNSLVGKGTKKLCSLSPSGGRVFLIGSWYFLHPLDSTFIIGDNCLFKQLQTFPLRQKKTGLSHFKKLNIWTSGFSKGKEFFKLFSYLRGSHKVKRPEGPPTRSWSPEPIQPKI